MLVPVLTFVMGIVIGLAFEPTALLLLRVVRGRRHRGDHVSRETLRALDNEPPGRQS